MKQQGITVYFNNNDKSMISEINQNQNEACISSLTASVEQTTKKGILR